MRVEHITGQQRLVDEVRRRFELSDQPSICLHGPSGGGKTWVARSVADAWQVSGGMALFASGDELCARRSHFPLLMAVSAETGRAHTKAVTRLALEPLTAIPFGGKPLREILHQVFERNEARAAAKTPFLKQEDLEVLLRIQKAANKRRVLLVCDNLQWWDDASLELLGLADAPAVRVAFPFLDNMAILALHTTDAGEAGSNTLRTLLSSRRWHTSALPLCASTSLDALLRAFGMTTTIPPELAAELFALTGGHLELVRRIADADATPSPSVLGPDAGSRSEFLFELLEKRLERHTSLPEETASVLRAASIIGTTFTDSELDCLLKDEEGRLGPILEPAERMKILERSGKVRTFVHDLVRTYYFQHAKTSREELHQRFSECLRLLHAGDFARREEHLRRAGNLRAANEVFVLEYLRAARAGAPPSLGVLDPQRDTDLASYVGRMSTAQAAFDAGRYVEAIHRLTAIEGLYSDGLMAERDILLARSHIKLLTHAHRQMARDLLSRWGHLKLAEFDVWGRATLYLSVACVFLGDEHAAKEAERALYEALAVRVPYDPTAVRIVNHVRLKSNMLHSVQIARERLRMAIDYFGGISEASAYDPVHQCIGLVNLAANHIVEGEFQAAFDTSRHAYALIEAESSLRFSRPDILLTNLTIAGYLCGHLSDLEALQSARAIHEANGRGNDGPLLASNIGFLLAHQGRFHDASEALESLFWDLIGMEELDPYYKYFVGNNLSGSLWMEGLLTESERVWTTITPFAGTFIGQMAPYMRRRHELQRGIFGATSDEQDWDGFLAVVAPPQVGPGWKFYGRGFLAAELEYWSDE